MDLPIGVSAEGVDVWGKNGNCLFTGEGCLDGISDSSEEKEYTAFVKDDVVLLKENDVDIDGYIWANKVIVPEHDVFKKYIKDYTTVGNILLNSDYSASGFSASNYILSPSVITEPENNTYLFVTRVTTGDDSSSRNIFGRIVLLIMVVVQLVVIGGDFGEVVLIMVVALNIIHHIGWL